MSDVGTQMSIRAMNQAELRRAKEREAANKETLVEELKDTNTCVSCGVPAKNDFCEFCLEEE